jgi:hypothetical protein
MIIFFENLLKIVKLIKIFKIFGFLVCPRMNPRTQFIFLT